MLSDDSPADVVGRDRPRNGPGRSVWARLCFGVLIAAFALGLTGCAGTSPTQQATSVTPTPSTSTTTSATRTSSIAPSPSVAASNPPPPSSPAAAAAAAAQPDCTKEALHAAVNADRSPDNQLTVGDTDFKCQETWAVAGANDLVNKAQYTILLKWTDDQWQPVADRGQACASGEVPPALLALGCHSN